MDIPLTLYLMTTPLSPFLVFIFQYLLFAICPSMYCKIPENRVLVAPLLQELDSKNLN